MTTSEEWIQFTSLGVNDDLLLDVRVSPSEALSCLERAINQRPRRVFGVLKVDPEYVGLTGPGEFEIWERRQHAVHAHGRIEVRPGGARVRAIFAQSRRTWALLVVFFLLYGVFGAGFVSRDPGPLGPLFTSLVVLVGGLAIALFFFLSARRQRSDLRRFISRVFADVADGSDGKPLPATPATARSEPRAPGLVQLDR